MAFLSGQDGNPHADLTGRWVSWEFGWHTERTRESVDRFDRLMRVIEECRLRFEREARANG
jgi:hypothetical protein